MWMDVGMSFNMYSAFPIQMIDGNIEVLNIMS